MRIVRNAGDINMTLRALLESLDIKNQELSARYSDGSRPKDKYMLVVWIDGHGKPLNSKIEEIHVSPGMSFILSKGDKGK